MRTWWLTYTHYGRDKIPPSVSSFPECQKSGTRGRIALGEEWLSRVPQRSLHSVKSSTRERPFSPSATLGEDRHSAKKHVTWRSTPPTPLKLFKKNSSPSAFPGTRGRIFVFLSFNGVGRVNRQVTCFFAECRSSPSVALGEEDLCRVLIFTECQDLCGIRESLSSRVQFFPKCNTRGRFSFPSARFLALGEARDTRGILPLP